MTKNANSREAYESYNLILKNRIKTETTQLNALVMPGEVNNESAFTFFEIVKLNIALTSSYLNSYRLAQHYINSKNDAPLVDARRGLTNAIITLEKIYTRYLDVPFSDYEQPLKQVLHFDEFERYDLICTAGFFCDYLASCYGENSRLRWIFVELKGRIVTLFKNSFDLKNLLGLLDPRADNFAKRQQYVNLNRTLMMEAANGYRTKYELSGTFEIADFRRAIDYLSALKRFSLMLNQNALVAELTKQIEVWTIKLESDLKKREK
ncbi:MAG: hypothetical protein FWE37_09465 [Spirochaetaceae bacterium]|nr:hypothetical protein [Spirochaetaceae bacterium]